MPAKPKIPWTEEEDQYLLSHPQTPVRDMAQHLGRPYANIVQRRGVLANRGLLELERQPGRRPWTEAEEEYLREHYSQHTLGVLAQKLNRSELGIVLKKRRLGLHKVDDFYTLQLLGELLLMDSHKVKWLVQQKYLKGRRAEWTMGLNKVWVVREEDVEAMLRQHPYVVHRPWRDLPESYARTVVEEEWRRDPWHNGPQAAKYAGVHRHTLNRFLNEGRLTGAQMSPDLKWSKWYVRQSVLDRLKEEMKKQEAARGERTSAAYRKTRPTKLSTRWSVPCSCGEPHMVEAPPKARGPDARALAQQQYHAEPALAESPERELVTA